MATMLWDVDSHDYEEPGEQAICDAVLGAGEQDIVLLHDGRWPHWQTLRALRLALG
jgi:peptidoglycan/xylan/chitin deacetylase (PgdA/CDA1 family)